MLLWEAHRDLAASLGDYVELLDPITDVTVIPDGVRYSKVARDSYITRAMFETIRQILSLVPGIPHKETSRILQSVLPTLIYKKDLTIASDVPGWSFITTTIGNNIREQTIKLYSIKSSEINRTEHPSDTPVPRLLWLISAYIKKNSRITPVPIRPNYEAGVVLNFNIAHQTEPFLCFNVNSSLVNDTTIDLYDSNGKIASGDVLTLHYIPLPIACSNLNTTEQLIMCKTQEQRVLSLAKLYGLTDSQDINAETYLPMEIGLTQQKG